MELHEKWWVCPTGHKTKATMEIWGAGEDLDGQYCQDCYFSFLNKHIPKLTPQAGE